MARNHFLSFSISRHNSCVFSSSISSEFLDAALGACTMVPKAVTGQRKAMEVEKLLLGKRCNEFIGEVEAGKEAGFHRAAVNLLSTMGADPPPPFAVISGSHWNHCWSTCTGRWVENQRISKRTVQEFWKANIVILLDIKCWGSLNTWLLLLCLNSNWSVGEICSNSGY